MDAAIEMGELRDAAALVADGRAASPDDPRMWMMAADLARARGDNGQVLNDLRTAQTLRRQQIGDDQPASQVSRPSCNDVAGGAAAIRSAAATPRRRRSAWPMPAAVPTLPAGSALNADPMTADIARAIVAAQAEVAPLRQPGAGLSGAHRLDRPRSAERGDGADRGVRLAGRLLGG